MKNRWDNFPIEASGVNLTAVILNLSIQRRMLSEIFYPTGNRKLKISNCSFTMKYTLKRLYRLQESLLLGFTIDYNLGSKNHCIEEKVQEEIGVDLFKYKLISCVGRQTLNITREVLGERRDRYRNNYNI